MSIATNGEASMPNNKQSDWPRANPEDLANFDPSTKVCVMNCGPSTTDPRSKAERRFLCTDCEEGNPGMERELNTHIPEFLLEMSKQMAEQPNRMTAHPFWQVRCKRYLPTMEGYNEHHWELVGDDGVIWKSTDPIEDLVSTLTEDHPEWCASWLEDRDEIEGYGDTYEAMKECFDPSEGEYPDELTWLPVQEIEEVVTTHLTQSDAEWFIKRKQHDYPPLYTWVESAYWSPQLRQLQDWIISLNQAAIADAEK